MRASYGEARDQDSEAAGRFGGEEVEKIAIEFENREFTPEELVEIAATRRSMPGLTRTAAGRSGTGGE